MASKRTAAPDATPKKRPQKAAPDPLMTPSASAPPAKAPVAAPQAVEAKPKRKMGAPSIKTPELLTALLKRLSMGESMRAICADPDMPSESVVYEWLEVDTDFAERYAQARARAMDRMADEILEIADDGTNDTYEDSDGHERTDAEAIQRSKLRVDARKWLMSKLAPKKYGDSVNIKHSGGIGIAAIEMDEEQAKRVAQQILAGTGDA
jgi:hypothetical protein